MIGPQGFTNAVGNRQSSGGWGNNRKLRNHDKELDLALLLITSLTAPFEAAKYRDGYREKLDALIAAKLEGKALTEVAAPRLAPVVNILDALQRSLDSMARKSVVRARAAGTSRERRRLESRAQVLGEYQQSSEHAGCDLRDNLQDVENKLARWRKVMPSTNVRAITIN